VVETASKTNYTTLSVDSGTSTVGLGNAPAPGVDFSYPELFGSLSIGSTLTATPGKWGVAGLTFKYAWEYSTDQTTWHPLTPTTPTTYVIPDSAFGVDVYRITVTASAKGYTDGTAMKTLTSTPGIGQIQETKAPVVTYSNGTYSISTGT
jgi:hypothetical protein